MKSRLLWGWCAQAIVGGAILMVPWIAPPGVALRDGPSETDTELESERWVGVSKVNVMRVFLNGNYLEILVAEDTMVNKEAG